MATADLATLPRALGAAVGTVETFLTIIAKVPLKVAIRIVGVTLARNIHLAVTMTSALQTIDFPALLSAQGAIPAWLAGVACCAGPVPSGRVGAAGTGSIRGTESISGARRVDTTWANITAIQASVALAADAEARARAGPRTETVTGTGISRGTGAEGDTACRTVEDFAGTGPSGDITHTVA